ncbi:MAG: hypothetical protein M3301_03580 [Chloroflexota bacterium]|nr:hypothetical protein [Chloroflexota bacterium]
MPLIQLLLMGCGVASLLLGALVLRRVSGYRVARILRMAPTASVAEAAVAAGRAEQRYVQVRGRITSREEFPDEHDRPLVFRRRRLEVAERPGEWRIVEEERLAVPFGLEERGAYVAVDAEALDEGLVVLPREAAGRAEEVPDRVPEGTSGQALVRHRVDQVSAVEHAVVAGTPLMMDGVPTLTAGLGRPLILTTLDPQDAVRVLAAGRRREVVLAAVLLVSGLGLVVLSIVLGLAGLVPASR